MKNRGGDYLKCRNVEIIVAMRLYWYFATRSRFATINSQLQMKVQLRLGRYSFRTSFNVISEDIIYIQVGKKFVLMNEHFPMESLNLILRNQRSIISPLCSEH